MYFTPQQLSGGPKYSFKTRVGNWSEDKDFSTHGQREYLYKKDSNHLVINKTQQKFAKSFQRVPHTFSEDGLLRYGDNVMLMNKATNGFLVFDMGDKITSADEAYSCTTSNKDVGACGRSILSIEKVNPGDDNIVRYGEQVRFVTNPWIFHKPLYLHSTQATPQVFARFSRNQEVCLNTKNAYNTVWQILPPQGQASPLIGEPVQPNTELLIDHCATREYLSSEPLSYGNDFGTEFEVSAKKQVFFHKGQQLFGENKGLRTIESSDKKVVDKNTWQILTAQTRAAAEPVEAPEALSYDGSTLLQDIRKTLIERGSLTVRGLVRLFRSFDSNKNLQVDASELEVGLRNFGINLTTEQVAALVKYFDKDGSKTVNLNEFLATIRRELNDVRIGLVRAAYEKLDVNQDGLVKLDDIAKIYSVKEHPEVKSGSISEKEAYLQFMSLWETEKPDGIVTWEEFAEYFSDISASIDSDEQFAAIMRTAWGI